MDTQTERRFQGSHLREPSRQHACGQKLIVLADPPSTSHSPHGSDFPNLGVLYVGAALRKKFPEYHFRYLDAHHSLSEHVDFVERLRPEFYGLSYASVYAAPSRELLNVIKRRSPSTVIMCGGPHPTADPIGVLATTSADVVCVGEGEVTAPEIVETIAGAGDLRNVPGIAYRNARGRIVTNQPRPLIRDLDSGVKPDWDSVDFSRFVGCRRSRARPSTSIVASRGCPFDCVFCSSPVWKLSRPWFRKRSPRDVAEEVESLYRRGVREIYIRSDEMNADLNWAISIFDHLAGLGHADLVFQCNLRAAPITPSLAEAMSRARCWLCHVGVESGSQRVLDGIRKGITIANIREGLGLLHAYRIKCCGFFMLYQAWERDGELCVESSREVLSSLKLAIELRLKGTLDYMSWGFATAYPGSALYETASKFRLMRRPPNAPLAFSPWHINMRLPGVSRVEMALLRGLGMFVQGGLFLCNRDSYNRRTAATNLKHAFHKLRLAGHI